MRLSIVEHVGHLLFAAVLFLFGSVSPVCAGDHDLEWWTWETLTLDLPESFFIDDSRLWLEHVNRFDEDVHNHLRWHGSVGILFPMPGFEDWSLLPVYRRMTDNVNTGREKHENRFHLEVFRRWKKIFSTEWGLKFRTRFDVRDVDRPGDITYRIRPLLQLSHALALQIRSEPLRFFVSEEMYYDYGVDHWTRSRATVGLKYRLDSNVDLTLGYMVESNWENPDWDHDNVLLTGFDLRF